VVELEQPLERQALAPNFDAADPHLRLDALVAEYAEVLRESYWAKESSLAAVEQLAAQSVAPLAQEEAVAEFMALLAKAATLKAQQ
jgi:hypothetical protein